MIIKNHANNIKNINMDNHVIQRFSERFNKDFTKRDIKEIVNKIFHHEAEPVYFISMARKVYIVEYKGITFGCVYNSQRRRLHTVFPTTWIEDGSFEQHLLKRMRVVA